MIDEKKLIEEVYSLFIAITGNPKQSTIVNECKKSFINMIEEQPKVGEWIPCSGCIDCKHKECENYGKV